MKDAPLVHYTEIKDLKADEKPVTTINQLWPESVKISTWRLEQYSKDFPILLESEEKIESGHCSIMLAGGRPGAKFSVVNEVTFKTGKKDWRRYWVNTYRNPTEAEKNLTKKGG